MDYTQLVKDKLKPNYFNKWQQVLKKYYFFSKIKDTLLKAVFV